METTAIREAIPVEPRVTLTLIKEGTPPAPVTEKQKAYNNAIDVVFTPQLELTQERVRSLLTTKLAEVEESIQNSSLKGATDRGGFTLGNLRDMTDIAIQELDGKLNAKRMLERVLEIETDNRETDVNKEAKDLVREGLVVNTKTGDIYLQSFPSQDKREMASLEASNKKADFQKAKERLQTFVASKK